MSAAKSPYREQRRSQWNRVYESIDKQIANDIKQNPGLETLEGFSAENLTEEEALLRVEADRAREELRKLSLLQQSLVQEVIEEGETLASWAQEHEISKGMASSIKQKTLRSLRYRLRGKEGE